MTTPSSSEPYGLSLPSRRANVTVTRRTSINSEEGDDSVGPLGRDSLEGTRRYYGVESSPVPGSSDRSVPRARKISSNTNQSRPLSQAPSESSFSLRSPPRGGSVPLPTPRGFLAPQKPAAARRLEQRERSTTVSTTGRASTDVRPSLDFGTITPSLSTPQVGTPNMSEFSHISRDQSSRPGTAAGGDAGAGLGINYSSLGPSRSPTPSHKSQVPSVRGPSPGVGPGTGIPRVPSTRRPIPSGLREVRDAGPQPIPQPATPTRTTDSGHGYQMEQIWDSGESNSPSHGTHGLHQDSSDHLVDVKALALGEKRKRTSDRPQSMPAQAVSRQRKYQVFAGGDTNVTFFCGGRLMTGGDSPLSFIVSVILHLGVSGVWLGTTGVWLCTEGNNYGLAKGGGIAITAVFCYLFLTSLSSMIAASFRDPGILPHGLDPDPPYVAVEEPYWEATPRTILVGEGGKDRVNCKYCETCKSYRPPRCSHCRLCGNCIEGIDHHCAYLHGCIGRRNYFAFLVFVITTAIAAIYIVVFSALHFSMLCHHDNINFVTALKQSPGAAVSFLLGVLVLPPILFLLYYHVRLLLYNLTTLEQIRASASTNLLRATQRPYNPFAASTRWKNIIRASIGRPQYPSWIDGSGYHQVDNRKVNPALTTAEKYLELV